MLKNCLHPCEWMVSIFGQSYGVCCSQGLVVSAWNVQCVCNVLYLMSICALDYHRFCNIFISTFLHAFIVQKDRLIRRHSAHVFVHCNGEHEDCTQAAKRNRFTVDFSMLTVPVLSESFVHVSTQIQEVLFLSLSLEQYWVMLCI